MLQRQEGRNSQWTLSLLLLAAVGVMEFLLITLESTFSYIGYYLVEDYIIVPSLLFVGTVLTGKRTPFVRKRMLLAGAAVSWFAVVQMIHKLSGMDTHPIGTVFFVYLMAFPFAAVTEDRENRGLHWMGGLFIAACLVLTVYTLLLIFDCVPQILQDTLYWDGTRLHVLWHSNISACFFMIGIGFAVSLGLRIKKLWVKLAMVLVSGLLFLAMALTNCRTTLLMTCAFLGGTAFFAIIQKGGWKRIAVGLAAALVIAAGSFWFSGRIFQQNSARIERNIIAQLTTQETDGKSQAEGKETSEDAQTEGKESNEDAQTEAKDTSGDPQTEVQELSRTIRGEVDVDTETGEIKIVAENVQGSLANDLRSLNGRTGIWKAALQSVRDNKRIALWGTGDVGPAISWYNHFPVVHAHNSWMETLMRLGLPGLLLALVYTGIAIRSAWILAWSRHAELWKKILAMLTMCVMVAGFLEPYLFITNVYYHITDFIFFFLVGYLDYWREQLPSGK